VVSGWNDGGGIGFNSAYGNPADFASFHGRYIKSLRERRRLYDIHLLVVHVAASVAGNLRISEQGICRSTVLRAGRADHSGDDCGGEPASGLTFLDPLVARQGKRDTI
jgi:hypothetical protein